MTSLQELEARWLCRIADIGLFGRVLGSNASLRVLDVRCRPCCDQGAHQPHLLASEASVMASCVSDLKRHCYLRRLAVDPSLCTLEGCRLFIGAIANAPVDAVTVRNVADDGCLQALYATIRQHDLSRKVIVEDHHVGPADVKFVADFVLDSWAHCELSMEALESSSCWVLLWCLCPGVTRNHSLLVATLPDCDAKLEFETATLHDVTRRNRHLVVLASRFVILYPGGDPYGRDVLPLVAKHPKLAKTTAREAGVTETVAETMIADALQLVAPCPNA
ncbi:hypothetical protein HPB52_019261 [Rhipicephalus sanguineus]|uniref:Uncharacterized protein n=1 Tax=Rhipicephalus sanguineus TaxID=34632 RepID=A0A9D4PJY7_RHISA|nr:hypothetical protein HPB52_019261 [Rhipicephalus sanguineus]